MEKAAHEEESFPSIHDAIYAATHPKKMEYFEALDFLFENGVGGRAASSGEQVCAQIIMSLYDDEYPMPLARLGYLSGQWREAANTVISGWQPDDRRLHSHLARKYGQSAWDHFFEENQFRRKE